MTTEKTSNVASIEEVRDYWNRRPCNIRHSQKVVGTKDYFDEVEARKYFVEPHIPGFAEFDKWNGKKVLEVGCGIGTDAVNFARAGADYSAIELSVESIEIAKNRFKVFDLEGNFQLLNGENLSQSFTHNSFDLVYSFGVIHHSPNPRAIIQEVRNVIKDDGELRIMLYARKSWKSAMIDAGFDQPEAQSGCPIAFVYEEQEVENLLGGLFKVTEIRQDHIFPFVVENYVNYEYELQPWFNAMPNEMFRALETNFGWHMLITAKPI